ncbi:MAG: HlyC/CorC family transporter [Candidatus Omnitrophica bacterium]|nr:HlyC/CorC family transporter [Candidatus Omnitrophota bacterium]
MASVLFLLLIIIVAAALCAVSEAALLSLSSIKVRLMVEDNKPNSKDLFFLKENISQSIASIVILNNIITIVGSIFIGELVVIRFGNKWLGWTSAIVTMLIIVCGEIVPKTFGERYKETIGLIIAKPFRFIVWVLKPVVFLTTQLSKPFIEGKTAPRVTEKEIRAMLSLARKEGTVERDEEILCHRVFKLNDVRAVHIMRPIDSIFAFSADKSLENLKDEIINARYSRIAVYDKDPADIVGMVQHRVLLREIAKDNYKATVRDFMVPPIFVNWFIRADELLEKFQAYHQHLFVVQDSQGKDVGLVSMEDVLEELFGEIFDEKG